MKNTTLLLLLLIAPLVVAQTSDADLTVGYQSVDITGLEDLFRSQRGHDDGLIIENFDYTLVYPDQENTSWLDRLRINANGFGGVAHGRVRVLMDGRGGWQLTLDYQAMERYSNLPSNSEALTDGYGRHSYDRDQQSVSLELTLPSYKGWTPVFQYRATDLEGPGLITYHLGEEAYLLANDLDESDRELSLGVRFSNARVQGEIMQGFRDYRGREERALVDGQGRGRPYLGEDLFLSSYAGTYDSDGETPSTHANVQVTVNERLRLTGAFLQAEAETDVDAGEVFSGRLAENVVNRFYNGGSQTTGARAELSSQMLDLHGEADLSERVTVQFGYRASKRELDGNALMTLLFLDSVTFGGGNPGDVSLVLEAEPMLEREQDLFEVQIAARVSDEVRLRAGYSVVTVDTQVLQSELEQILVDGQGGDFEREIDRLELGADWSRKGNRVSLNWRREEADEAVLRTDFLERDLIRFRAKLKLGDQLLFTANGRINDAVNDIPGIDLDSSSTSGGLHLDFTANEQLSLFGGYSLFDFESTLRYRDPWFLPQTSIHIEDGDGWDLGLRYDYKSLLLTGTWSTYENTGAVNYSLDRYHLQLDYALSDQIHGIVTAINHEYSETTPIIAAYDADIYRFLLRWKR